MEKGNSKSSFLLTGFKNWKDGTVAFKDHQASLAAQSQNSIAIGRQYTIFVR